MDKNTVLSHQENFMSSRYARHELIPGWSQQQLADARVIIFGMGALGNEVARILAMSGVGSLLLCDPDRVEESNLSRTVLFRQSHIGQ
jgi:molybdopterin/thiamine biosynthesis adenylyltransferase